MATPDTESVRFRFHEFTSCLRWEDMDDQQLFGQSCAEVVSKIRKVCLRDTTQLRHLLVANVIRVRIDRWYVWDRRLASAD